MQRTHRQVRRRDLKRQRHACATAVSAVRRAPHRGAKTRLTQPCHAETTRQGSTLMIVIVLLGLLSVLGVLFYTFAAAERANSEYYSNAAKVEEDPGLTADELFDFALQQVIIGTDPRLKNSALWGSRHAIVPNAVGLKNHQISDLAAFDGTGVNVIVGASGEPAVDQNFDGAADGGNVLDDAGLVVNTSNIPSMGLTSNPQDLLGFNDSPAANFWYERDTGKFPQPDAGYTYPDQNSLFLAHIGWVRDRASGAVRRVVIPSFHRPQLLRKAGPMPLPLWEDRNYNGTLDAGEDINGSGVDDLDISAANFTANSPFINRSLRPHPGHLYVPPNTQNATTSARRFVATAAEALALFGDGKHVFPFLPMYSGYDPSSGGTTVNLPSRPANWVGNQGVWSADPASNPATIDDIQYDVDNDGDGIREGIFMDMDFPVQELADGTLYIPMFSVTVLDQNGLFDLNSHGNIQQLLFNYSGPGGEFPFDNTGNPFGWNTITGRMEFISASNQGMHAAEVNPSWGFTARPGIEIAAGNISTVFDQHGLFYGNTPPDVTATMTTAQQRSLLAWQQVANMEYAWSKMGRPQLASATSIDDLYPGVYGEEHLVAQQVANNSRDPRYFPHPGVSIIDDNTDLNEGMQFTPRSLTRGSYKVWLDVDQPMDQLGSGWLNYQAGNYGSGMARSFKTYPGTSPTNKLYWPIFTGYSSNGNVFWGNTNVQAGNLLPDYTSPVVKTISRQPNGLFDDPNEVALYATDSRDVDDPLGPSEAAYLAAANADITNLGLSSRLQNLVKVNFSTSDNTRGEDIRKRYTTVSNDRKNFAIPRAPGVTGRHWEWTDDQGRTAVELNAAQLTGQFKLRFPPTFGDAGTPIARYAANDPFRSPVRYLLQSTRDDLTVSKQYQQKLSINQLLTFNNTTKKLEYRDLTNHPLDPGATQIAATTVYPPQTAAQFEYWARRDRQQLARDIYVLLYLTGSGLNGTSTNNPTRTSWQMGTNAYTSQQLEQMARFAVNLVDAQDRDNVMTRFEYDTDLSDGWSLDDNPYTTDVGTQRAEVWGVERQELAFSEAILVQTADESGSMGMGAGNTANTSWDDLTERQFLCVELRNLAPYDVKFTDEEEAWRIVIRQVEPQNMAYDATKERRIALRNNAGYVKAGGFYTLFSTDHPQSATLPTYPSVMQVNPDPSNGTSMTNIVPSPPLGDTFTTQSADANHSHIDLVEDAVTSGGGVAITDGANLSLTGTAGAALKDPNLGAGPGNFYIDDAQPVHIILQRRAHPTRIKVAVADDPDNPWVEVDRIAFNVEQFDYPNSGSSSTAELGAMQSTERTEPLSRNSEVLSIAAAGTYAANTFGNNLTTVGSAENVATTDPAIQIRQIHPDRQFVSLGEVLDVPVVGPPPYSTTVGSGTPRPDGLTTYFGYAGKSPELQYTQPVSFEPAAPRFQQYAKTALGMFAVPDNPAQGTVGTVEAVDNRWHRLLEFIEVPTRQSRNLGLGNEFDIARVAGKINLNTIRHPEVLAGLLDDESVAELDLIYPPDTPPSVVPGGDSPTISSFPVLKNRVDPAINMDPNDTTGYTGGLGGWFTQFLQSRDQEDPYWFGLGQRLSLPGLPINTPTTPPDAATMASWQSTVTGRPFRSPSFAQDTLTRSPQHTLLRALPYDVEQSGTPSKRMLFEVGDQANDHNPSSASIEPLNGQLRHRILSKLWNNTTTRSNSFVIFVSAKLFRASVDPTTGAVRIGGPLKDIADTPAPELPEYRGVFVVDRSDLEGGGLTAGSGLTSFRPFVKYRRTLHEE